MGKLIERRYPERGEGDAAFGPLQSPVPSAAGIALGFDVNGVNGLAGGHEQAISFTASAKLQVRCTLYNGNFGSGFGQKFRPANDPYPPTPVAA
jgi:hypothetical protein